MTLDNIKNQTTWSDAAASINKNFGKISNAIRQGLPVINTPVDDELSDESDNAIANKAVADALKEKQDALVSGENIKTVNGQSLLGKGNIEIQGGGAGLQYSVERTVHPNKVIVFGDCGEEEITDEERAYNAETFTKAWNDNNVVVSLGGGFLSYTLGEYKSSTGVGQVMYNSVAEIDDALVSHTAIIYSNGDATVEIKEVQTGSAPRVTDFSSDFNKDF